MIRKRKGNPDPLKPESLEFSRRQSRNAHNACFGGIAMAKVWMRNIHGRATVTQRGKELAEQIDGLLNQLGDELKTRIDQ